MVQNVNVNKLKSKVDNIDGDLKQIKSKLVVKKVRPQLRNRTHVIVLKKAFIDPNFESKTVLTDSTWDYVLTYLIRSANDEAVFYWEQARNFYTATLSLDIVSAPLTAYYCFLNATKALLKLKGIAFDFKHGVSGERVTGQFKLQNEIIRLQTSGVLSGLCLYLKEPVQSKTEYTLKDILYNLNYIHRAYTLTYGNDTELYIPIFNPQFVFDGNRNEGWFQFQLEECYSNKQTLNKLVGYGIDKYYDASDIYTIRRNKVFTWETTRNKPTDNSINSFKRYYRKIRLDLLYIFSSNELWYIKRKDLLNRIINRNSMVLTMAAMHRLSELSRYEPQTLKRHLEKEQSWLLREFINKSILQFIDNISSEITGVDFRQTGFRN